MAQISVRPNRVKFIAALNASIKRIEKEHEEYNTKREAWRAAMETWQQQVNLSPDNIKELAVSNEGLRVTAVLKKAPKGKPKEFDDSEYTYKYAHTVQYAVQDIVQVIKLLELVDDEHVNASVANRVAQYL